MRDADREVAVTTTTGTGGARRRRRRLALRAAGVLVGLLVASALGLVAWLAVGDDAVVSAAERAVESHAVQVTDRDGVLTIRPESTSSELGVVFLPGARIERAAYVATWAPTVEATGATVFIPGVPFNLPLLAGDDLVEGIVDANDDFRSWVVGGHSMGGFEAGAHATAVGADGLLLWAAGAGRTDLSSRDLPTLVIAGESDGVVSLEMILRDETNLPMGARVEVIEGMSHGQFGRYRDPGDTDVADPSRRSDADTLAELTTLTSRFLRRVATPGG